MLELSTIFFLFIFYFTFFLKQLISKFWIWSFFFSLYFQGEIISFSMTFKSTNTCISNVGFEFLSLHLRCIPRKGNSFDVSLVL